MRRQLFNLKARIQEFVIVVGLLHAVNLGAAEQQSVIVLFGDSITTGFNANFQDARFGNGSTTRGCPTIYLNNILRQEEPRTAQQSCPTESLNSPILDQNNRARSAIVANWGIGGSNTTTGESRISINLSQTQSSLDADDYYVLIMYGTNDPAFGISSTTTGFNIRQMINKARALNYEPIIGTITPRDDIDISPYNIQVVNAANAEGAFVVDHFSRFVNEPGGWQTLIDPELDPDTGQFTRLHPNDQGYLVIAETWFEQRLKDVVPLIPTLNIVPILDILLND